MLPLETININFFTAAPLFCVAGICNDTRNCFQRTIVGRFFVVATKNPTLMEQHKVAQ
jgi:hypothetical protein